MRRTHALDRSFIENKQIFSFKYSFDHEWASWEVYLDTKNKNYFVLYIYIFK